LTFLGTAGGRIVVFKQFLASGGLWLESEDTNVLIDPGPGSLLKCLDHKLDPMKLDAILLTHRHTDHSADVNVIIEAMAEGGLKPRGTIYAPPDCYNDDPVILKYNDTYVEKKVVIQEEDKYELGKTTMEFPIKHQHTVDTFGVKFSTDKYKLSYIVDTTYFDELIPAYSGCDILMMNMVFNEHRGPKFKHLCFDDAVKLIEGIKPQTAIITHFGVTVWKAQPWTLAEKLQEQTGIRTIAARDGMKVELDSGEVDEMGQRSLETF
jgi:ribonuclease BN (tRNA processing enzyme)